MTCTLYVEISRAVVRLRYRLVRALDGALKSSLREVSQEVILARAAEPVNGVDAFGESRSRTIVGLSIKEEHREL